MKFPVQTEYKKESIPITITYAGTTFTGTAIPVSSTCSDGVCFELEVTLNNIRMGRIHFSNDSWRMDDVVDQEFVDAIGNEIFLWYE